MEKERKVKILSLVALVVAVLGLTVAFAALSQTLTINGTASVDAATWNVHFDAITSDDYEALGDATLNTNPVVSGTTISNIDMTVTKPGDQALYIVKILNEGTIDAKLESITIPTLCSLNSPVESCDWNNDGQVTQDDVDKVNDNINFMFRYSDTTTGKMEEFLPGDTLTVEEKEKDCIISLTFGSTTTDGTYIPLVDSTELPKRNLSFNNLSITLNYVQAD